MKWRVAVVALLAVAAGCAALGGGMPDGETVTPAPVPTITTTEGTALPPGVTGGGSIDVDALAEAHLAALDNRSYVRRVGRSLGGRTINSTLRVESATRYRYERSDQTDLTNASEFADGVWLYSRFVQFSTRFSFGEVEEVRSRHETTATRSIRRHLSLSNATVAETRVDDALHYEVTAERDRYEAIGTTTDFRVRAVITPDGLVRALDVSYVDRYGDGSMNVSYSHRYERRAVTVERPAWVEREFGGVNETNAD